MSSRNYTIIRTNKTQERCLGGMAVPYGYIGEGGYTLDEIRCEIVVETEAERAEAGDFPRNIQEHFWVRVGENDGDNWISCGVLENGAYFLYQGGCDYTGFDCQGGMSLWVSNSWKNIVDHAMAEYVYEFYLKQNEPEPEEEGYPICSHCHAEEGTMPNEFTDEGENLCADCYWDMDSAMKKERRADPAWRFSRAYSAAKVLLNKTDEEALAIATAAVNR